VWYPPRRDQTVSGYGEYSREVEKLDEKYKAFGERADDYLKAAGPTLKMYASHIDYW
jgi:hypothetical protein